ncbi:NO-inducible flavohemoprotein [Vibrio sp. YMD68]|nr:NO-inducible flavohemoprotein [Vibrio sp. YMD68]WGV98738.1 NO-inducible flavohemoprotein [Vibrio sp. YMD68]
MLNEKHIATIKSTIPLLENAGPVLTQHFYQRMFTHHPELKDIFNMTHQKTGRQSVALFEAIAAYAKNIENLAALTSAVERIAQKHTSFNIQAEHYQIVGHHLIETLRELAGEAFSPDVEEAWTAAYLFLAQVFIDREGELYLQRKQAVGGWENSRPFVVTEKIKESELVTSFVLTPEDNKAVLDYLPGQYIGVEVKPTLGQYSEIRQYSLSQQSNGKRYRISVKRESQGTNKQGLVSNYLHQDISVGDGIHVFAPAGDFFYQETQKPVVLISAGVGATPIQAMLQTLDGSGKQDVTYLHACHNQEQHSFLDETSTLTSVNNWQQFVWYFEGKSELDGPEFNGTMDLNAVASDLPLADGDFYICGPIGFMESVVLQLQSLKVSRDRIHYEVFGPHSNL